MANENIIKTSIAVAIPIEAARQLTDKHTQTLLSSHLIVLSAFGKPQIAIGQCKSELAIVLFYKVVDRGAAGAKLKRYLVTQ